VIRVLGVERALRGLAKFGEDAVKHVEKMLAAAAVECMERARENAPVRTGRLRESITVSRHGKLAYVVEASAPYAGYVEFGTSRQRPRRYMQTALLQTLQTLRRQL
jgi:HK97 gp10 family phage protein